MTRERVAAPDQVSRLASAERGAAGAEHADPRLRNSELSSATRSCQHPDVVAGRMSTVDHPAATGTSTTPSAPLAHRPPDMPSR